MKPLYPLVCEKKWSGISLLKENKKNENSNCISIIAVW